MTRFSLDSNVLVYAADSTDARRHASAVSIIGRAARQPCVLTPQAFAEFFAVTSRKSIMPRAEAVAQIRDWIELFSVSAGPTADLVLAAAEAAASGRFQFYDALLLATAGAAGCEAVISEDMHPGATLAGARVVPAFDAGGGIGAEALALLRP